MDYQEAKATLNGRKSKKVANNTYLIDNKDGSIALRYHETDVITYWEDRFQLNSGGWKTYTTKDRISRFIPSPWVLYSDRGIWYLQPYYYQTKLREYNGKLDASYPFHDGITIYPDPEDPYHFRIEGYYEGAAEEDRKLRVLAREYAKEFTKQLYQGLIPLPDMGDCLFCIADAQTKEGNFGGSEHIIAHFEEPYFVPSLLVRALEKRGSNAAKYVAATLMETQSPPESLGGLSGIVSEQIEKAIYRHCCEKIGVAA